MFWADSDVVSSTHNPPSLFENAERFPMLTKINNGVPLRFCSWSFNPIVPTSLSGTIIRWLDVVCLKQVSFKAGRSSRKTL